MRLRVIGTASELDTALPLLRRVLRVRDESDRRTAVYGPGEYRVYLNAVTHPADPTDPATGRKPRRDLPNR